MSDIDLRDHVKSLYRDCCDLANYIADARREISAMRPGDLKDNQIPRAGQELDAIVKATETATEAIMAATEQIIDEAGRSGPVNDACMRIFEACSFQDITGQRITKVVKTLEHIESRLDVLQKAWGPDFGQEEPEAPRIDGDAGLLNGPQLAGEGVSQADVDALLGEDRTIRPNGGAQASQSEIDALFD